MHKSRLSSVDEFLRNRWRGMHKRCTSRRPEVSKNYADRGISVCREWATFEPFRLYVSETIGLPDLSAADRWTIDRTDNDKGYMPGNIRWATYRENIRNRRSTVVVELKGERALAIELTERLGIPYMLFMDRVRRQGWSVERAVETPVVEQYRRTSSQSSSDFLLTLQGRTQSLVAWASELDFDIAKVRRRLVRGWEFERAVTVGYSRGNSQATKRLMQGAHPS